MAKLSDWSWWVGSSTSVELDFTYEIGAFQTRDEAIAAGLRETVSGETFQIIEARIWVRASEPPTDFMPFARTRNHEVIANG